MSRIGKLPIDIPSGVKVALEGTKISIEGPKGKNSKSFSDAISIDVQENQLVVKPSDQSRHSRAMWGTARSIIADMVQGVCEPYKKELEIQGVGFRATLKGKTLDLALGYSHPILYKIADGVTLSVDKSGTKIAVEGSDKQLVGQVAADIKSYSPAEPYKGKGVRIVGEHVLRKEGKKTA